MTVNPPQGHSAHPLRSWWYLVRLSWYRQARARLMVLVSLGLLAFMVFLIWLTTHFDRWNMWHWRDHRRDPMYSEYVEAVMAVTHGLPWTGAANSLNHAVIGSYSSALSDAGFYIFSHWVVFSTFATFLLPLWSLSFATDALGRERETGNLIWLLSRPLPRSSIYVAKWLAGLPWTLLLNLGGFGLMSWAAGDPGRLAWHLYWPAVLWGSLAFAALFHLFAVWFRRPAVVAILYSFFLETLMGNMPGYFKRGSISFYVRCMMFDGAADYGIKPERPDIYLPVSGFVAWAVLAGLTVGLLLVGIIIFSRKEYLDLD